MQSVVGRTFDRLSEEIGRYEGLLEKFMGDAVLAVFGVPRAHEDDAERAVRAGVGVQAPGRPGGEIVNCPGGRGVPVGTWRRVVGCPGDGARPLIQQMMLSHRRITCRPTGFLKIRL